MKDHYYSRHAGPLKAALKDAIPPSELRVLHHRSGWRHGLVALRQVVLLAACTAVLVHGAPAWIWVPAAIVQGFTVFNFTVLLHEVVHHLVFERPRPQAERWLAWLYAVPSGISASQFTRWHLDHHAELGSRTDDPKRFHLSPKRNARWLKALYLTPALFFIYFRAAAREARTYPDEIRRRIRFERSLTVAVHLALLGGLAALDPLMAMRVYAVPVLLIFPVAFTLNRLGQHYWVNPDDPAGWSTLVKGSWFWNVVFLNSNFHLEHHYFPGVPLYALPRLHRALQPFYGEHGLRAHGYAELLWNWFVLNKPPHARWEEAAPPLPSVRTA